MTEEVAGQSAVVFRIRILHTSEAAGLYDNPVQRASRDVTTTQRNEKRPGFALTDQVRQVRRELIGDGNEAFLRAFAIADSKPATFEIHVSNVQAGQLRTPDTSLNEGLKDAPISKTRNGVDDLIQLGRLEMELAVFELVFLGHDSFL